MKTSMLGIRRTSLLLASLTVLTTISALAMAGCGPEPVIYGCNYPIVGRLAKNGMHDACCDIDPCPGHCTDDPCPKEESDAGTDATTSEGGTSSCSGTCAPIPPFGGWEGPGLLWIGPAGSAPDCPVDAPAVAYQGHDGLQFSPLSCGTCSCSSPSGTCAPPLTLTASAKPCNIAGAITSLFDGPAAWDGACTAHDCISQDPACNQTLTVQSLTAAPLVMKEQGCTPSLVVPHDLNSPTWTNDVIACRGLAASGAECSAPGETCVPSSVPREFSICIYHAEDVSCPNAYPDKHVAYFQFDDHRTCSACACSAPSGSTCTAALSVFKDDACSVPLLGSDPLSSSMPSCFDIAPAGLPLGSKTVSALAYKPGTCVPSGAEALGIAEAILPSTFCCRMS